MESLRTLERLRSRREDNLKEDLKKYKGITWTGYTWLGQ